MSGSDPRNPGEFRAYAHRGGAGENAENSPTAFAHAVALGYRYLETDVRPSRDGVAVLHHDARLDRTTDGSGLVRGHTWGQLRHVRLADGSPPLRLEELLEAYPHAVINVDVKEAGSVSAVMAAVNRSRAWDRVCLTSFSGRRLRRTRRLAPPGTASSAHPAEVAAFQLALPRRGDSVRRIQVPPSVAGRTLVDARFVRRAHERGLAVDIWTIDDRAQMEALLELGVDGLMTDRPSLLREVLLARGMWPQAERSGTTGR